MNLLLSFQIKFIGIFFQGAKPFEHCQINLSFQGVPNQKENVELKLFRQYELSSEKDLDIRSSHCASFFFSFHPLGMN